MSCGFCGYPNSTVHRISELLSVSDGNPDTIFVFVSERKYPYSYPYLNYPTIIRSERYPYSFLSGPDGNYPTHPSPSLASSPRPPPRPPPHPVAARSRFLAASAGSCSPSPPMAETRSHSLRPSLEVMERRSWRRLRASSLDSGADREWRTQRRWPRKGWIRRRRPNRRAGGKGRCGRRRRRASKAPCCRPCCRWAAPTAPNSSSPQGCRSTEHSGRLGSLH